MYVYIGRIFVYCCFEMNVLRWCPFVDLLDTHFQNSPYGYETPVFESLFNKVTGLASV